MISIRFLNTQIKVTATVLLNLFAMLIGINWLEMVWHPERSPWQDPILRIATMFLLMFAIMGHVIAHIFSARFAKAPMDEILIAAGIPRTLYWNNSVSPDVHRLRAIGGPIFNLLGVLLSLGIYGFAPEMSPIHELAAWSAFGHGFTLVFSLMPVSIVDGGSLLKWTLVARGKPEAEADTLVQRINLGMCIGMGAVALVFCVMHIWVVVATLVTFAGVLLGIVVGLFH